MGEQVTITVKPEEGKEVTDVTVTDKDGKEIEVTDNGDGTYTYEQPAGDVKVEVELKDSEYDVELPAPEGGQVESDKDNPTMGEQVTITVKPDEGKEVTDVTVTDKDGKEIEVTNNGDGTYTYEQPAGDVKVEVEFRWKSYKVIFTDWNGETLSEQTVEHGKAASSPADPARTGYTFTGWDQAFASVTEPMTLKAQYRINQYTIDFNTADGSAVESITQDYGTAVTKPADPTKTGYDFGGWYADAQHTTSYVFGTMPAESITVYAKWTPADGTAYTVRHYLQNTACNGYELYEGEVLRGVTGEQTAAAAKTYPGFTPKTFAQTAILPDGSAVVEIFYDRNTYRVTLVTNNGILLEETVAEYIYGIGAKLPTRIAKGGFFFTGWYDNEACFGRPVTEITATDIGDKVFYAGWFFNYIPQITIPTAFTPAVQNGGNGSVTHSPAAAKAGETVTVTVTPDAGYGVKSITASDSMGRAVALTDNGNGTYRFTQPAAQVTLKVVFDQAELVCLRDASCPMYGFTDLDRKEWYHDAIHFCIENGLMEGMGNNIFAPDGTLTRAMIVTVLWRLEGQPVVNYAMSYTDVPQDRWYSEAVRWASAVKIVEGHGNGTYAPEDPVTREQLSAILHRYAAYKGVKDGELSAMPPYRCSEWAVGDVKWADSNGLYDGIGNDMKDMTSAAPRSEIAWMLYRYCVINGK